VPDATVVMLTTSWRGPQYHIFVFIIPFLSLHPVSLAYSQVKALDSQTKDVALGDIQPATRVGTTLRMPAIAAATACALAQDSGTSVALVKAGVLPGLVALLNQQLSAGDWICDAALWCLWRCATNSMTSLRPLLDAGVVAPAAMAIQAVSTFEIICHHFYLRVGLRVSPLRPLPFAFTRIPDQGIVIS